MGLVHTGCATDPDAQPVDLKDAIAPSPPGLRA